MSILFSAAKSTEEFAKVKAGLQGGDRLPYEYLWWFLAGIMVIVLISVAYGLFRKKRHSSIFRGWASITEPNRVAAVFKRAAARQANCTLEIFDHQHTNVYRGQVFEAKPGINIILELSRLPGIEADFEGFPAQVHLNFRPAAKEAMEHYQFSSHTLAVNYQMEKNWRVARVAVAWPKSIISAQRRDFLRVEPVGDHLMPVTVKTVGDEALTGEFDRLPALAEGTVLDISVGGAQLLIPGISDINESRSYLLLIDLPVGELELDQKDNRLYLVFSPLARDVIGQSADPAIGLSTTRTVIRGGFSGRYRRERDGDGWEMIDFSPEAFEDLSHWVHAYQRYLLKKEKDLMPSPVERVNIYPSIPPVRPTPKDDDLA